MKPLKRLPILFAMLIMLLSLTIGGAVSASDAEQSFEQPIAVVNTSFLNVRTGPGVEYTVLVTVVGGTELPVLGVFEDGVWYQVATDAGPGWINIEFALPRGNFGNIPLLDVGDTGAPNVDVGQGGADAAQQATQGTRITIPQLVGNTVIVNSSFLNLRSGPSAGFSIVTTVPGGTELAVLGRATDDVWLLIQGDFGQAWVNSEFVIFRGNYATVPVITEPVLLDTAPAATGQGSGAITTGRTVTGVSMVGKDLHQGPSYDSLILSRNTPNDSSVVYPLLAAERDADGNTWYLVDLPNVGRGWVDAVEFRPLECGTDTAGVLNRETPISFTGIANREPFLLPLGTEFYIVGRRNNETIIELTDQTVGVVNAGAVDGRTGVRSVCAGVTTTVGGQVGAGGGPVVGTQPQVVGNRVIVNTGNLNIRSGPNAIFSIVATVPGATELAVIGRATDNVWYFVEGDFGRGWLNSEFVLFRGDYGTVPVVDLSGS